MKYVSFSANKSRKYCSLYAYGQGASVQLQPTLSNLKKLK